MLAGLEGKPFVPHLFKNGDLLCDLIHGEFAARKLVLTAVAAVDTVVDAKVADVERGKQHQTLAVDLFLDLPRGSIHLFEQFRLFHFEKDSYLIG